MKGHLAALPPSHLFSSSHWHPYTQGPEKVPMHKLFVPAASSAPESARNPPPPLPPSISHRRSRLARDGLCTTKGSPPSASTYQQTHSSTLISSRKPPFPLPQKKRTQNSLLDTGSSALLSLEAGRKDNQGFLDCPETKNVFAKLRACREWKGSRRKLKAVPSPFSPVTNVPSSRSGLGTAMAEVSCTGRSLFFMSSWS